MKRILESGRYLVLLAVASSLVAAAATFLLGLWKTGLVIWSMAMGGGSDPHVVVRLIELMDKFLIAVGLYTFATGLYGLFLGDLDLPAWLETHDLHDIKGRLSQILVLFLAVAFLEHVVAWQDAWATLQFAIAISLVMGVLILFNALGEKKASKEPDVH